MRKDVRHDYGGKTSFGDVYDAGDPRPYFETLGRLDYREPEHGQRVLSSLVDAIRAGRGVGGITITDLCCSYGVIAALTNFGLTLDDLYAHYRSEELAGLSSEELAVADAAFYARRREKEAPEMVGVDAAHNAVAYALRVGLLDRGVAADLEREEPTEELARAVAGTDLVVVTGCVGYVVETSFGKLLAAMRTRRPEGPPKKPWVAAFASRFVHYEPISEVLAEHGLVTERLPDRTFPRRRFTGPEEQAYVLEKLAEKGEDPTGKEAEGWHHSYLYLSRPADESETPVQELLGALP